MAASSPVSGHGLLRPDLLVGRALLLAGPPGPTRTTLSDAWAELGASVLTFLPDGEDEGACDRAVAEGRPFDTLVVDGPGLLAGAAGDPLRACMDATWNITRAAVNHAFLSATAGDAVRRVVYLAPADHAGEAARGARAALENLARTLSVEWARHAVNVVTIALGERACVEEIAALVAYLVSPAGDYFSGCTFALV